MTNIPLVLLLGLISTIQLHFSKALERQGIEVFEQIKARLQRSGSPPAEGIKKPIIYSIGLLLNNTVFVWSILAQPHGPPALFTSMYGMGLVFLIGYAAFVLKEKIDRGELIAAAAIVLGTLAIGIENVIRPEIDRFMMKLDGLMIALGIWFGLALVFVIVSSRRSDLRIIALAFGILAGGLGSLDPFFKGIGQNYGGEPGFLPANVVGSIFFAASFLIGFLAFVVTQLGFARKVRASLLLPAYNAAFIGLPVLWQSILLPGYHPAWSTWIGLLLVISGVIGIQAAGAQKAHHR